MTKKIKIILAVVCILIILVLVWPAFIVVDCFIDSGYHLVPDDTCTSADPLCNNLIGNVSSAPRSRGECIRERLLGL